MLFALPAAIAVPITAGIVFGGPVVGLLLAAVTAIVIVVAAIRAEPRTTTAADRPKEGAPARPASEDREHLPDRRWRRRAVRRALVPLVMVAAGAVVIVATSGTERVIGWGVVAVGITVAISLLFLEIGYSEDRDRAREQRAAASRRRQRRRRAP